MEDYGEKKFGVALGAHEPEGLKYLEQLGLLETGKRPRITLQTPFDLKEAWGHRIEASHGRVVY